MTRKLLLPGALTAFLALCSALALHAQINVQVSISNPSCAGFTDGAATATASGGSGSYSYAWTNGRGGQTISGIGAGVIAVTVTDDQGNSGTASATLTDPAPLEGTFTQSGGQCSLTDGATIAVTGGTAPYAYSWDNGSTGASASGLGFGVSCVTVTDANGCEQIFCAHIEEPLSVVADATDVLCPGGCDAVIIARVAGGTRPYTYLWDDGFTGAINDMLLPGTYCVTVTDANGCTAQDCGTIGEPDAFAFDFAISQPSCGAANGSVTATVTGGTGAYSFSWSTGATSNALTGVGPGDLTLTVTDANGCTGDTTITVLASTDLTVAIDATSPACGVGATGTATANVTGGTAPFTYAWSSGSTAATAANLAPGNYTVTVTDANGCTGTASTTISAGSSLTVSASSTDVLCAGDANGSASVNVSGGQAPYTYLWTTGATDATIDGLAAGAYSVTVTDANGCAGTANVSVGSPDALTCSVTTLQEISLEGAADGILSAQFSGGVSPYTVAWSTGQATQTIDDLGPGTYTATVTDGNGCTTTCSATLVEPVTVLGKIGDFVFRDLNRNGQQDVGEPGVRGIRVSLILPDGTESAFQTTGADGMYCFGDLLPGDYQVKFEIKLGDDAFTLSNVGPDGTDSDAIESSKPQIGFSPTVTIGSGDTILTVDAGVFDACVPVDPGTIVATDEMVCGIGADPGPIVSSVPASSTGAIRYLWMFNDENDPNFTNWTPAPGVNNQASYDPGPLTGDTYFARCAFGVDCSGPVESNVVLITAGNDANAIIDGPTSVCVGERYTFRAINAGAGVQIEWDFGPNATPQTARGSSVSVTWGLFGQRNVQLSVVGNGCSTSATQRVTVSNCLVPDPFPTFASANGATVDVTWEMTDDTEPGHYLVERSNDGGATYFEVGRVDVTPGNATQRYAFADAAPKRGYNTYRVCRVLLPGDTYFSQPSSASLVADVVDLVAFPNPAVDRVVLERFEGIGQRRVVELVDQTGRVVATGVFPAGESRTEVSVEGAAAGEVHVRLRGDRDLIGSTTILKQ